MNCGILPRLLILIFITGVAAWAQSSSGWHDPSPHKVQFVTVEESVRLEVLNWGGVRIVELPGANRYLFPSNAVDVIREVRVLLVRMR